MDSSRSRDASEGGGGSLTPALSKGEGVQRFSRFKWVDTKQFIFGLAQAQRRAAKSEKAGNPALQVSGRSWQRAKLATAAVRMKALLTTNFIYLQCVPSSVHLQPIRQLFLIVSVVISCL